MIHQYLSELGEFVIQQKKTVPAKLVVSIGQDDEPPEDTDVGCWSSM